MMGLEAWTKQGLGLLLLPFFIGLGRADPICTDRFISSGPEPRPSAANWSPWQAQLVQEVKAADKAGQGPDLVVWGDSVVEQFRGSAVGQHLYTISGAPPFNEAFGWLRPLVLAISGDYTVNLQWRLANGEMLTAHQPKVALVYIGSNDLNPADCNNTAEGVMSAAPGVVARVAQIVATIRSSLPSTHIVLLALFPRGAKFWLGDQNPYERWIWPNRFTPALQYINAGYQAIAAADPSHVTYLDCGEPYAEPTGIRRDRLLDGCHPTEVGMELFVACLAPVVDALAGGAPAGPANETAAVVGVSGWGDAGHQYTLEQSQEDEAILASLLSGDFAGASLQSSMPTEVSSGDLQQSTPSSLGATLQSSPGHPAGFAVIQTSDASLDAPQTLRTVNATSSLDDFQTPRTANATSSLDAPQTPRTVNATSSLDAPQTPRTVNATSSLDAPQTPRAVNATSALDDLRTPRNVNATSSLDDVRTPRTVNAMSSHGSNPAKSPAQGPAAGGQTTIPPSGVADDMFTLEALNLTPTLTLTPEAIEDPPLDADAAVKGPGVSGIAPWAPGPGTADLRFKNSAKVVEVMAPGPAASATQPSGARPPGGRHVDSSSAATPGRKSAAETAAAETRAASGRDTEPAELGRQKRAAAPLAESAASTASASSSGPPPLRSPGGATRGGRAALVAPAPTQSGGARAGTGQPTSASPPKQATQRPVTR